MFGINDLSSVWHVIGAAPIFVWELSLGIYLVVKGFKPSPRLGGVRHVPLRYWVRVPGSHSKCLAT